MRLFKKLSHRINYLELAERQFVEKAFLLAAEAHQKQKRHSGEPYITHPVAVACILADMRFDAQTLAAALLHDVIEDTEYTREDLVQAFGEDVAAIVDGVSKLTKIEFKSRVEAQAENFRKMILAMIKDMRVILVKLADRLHNMRTLGPLRPDKKRRIAQETLEIYAPIARRLGMRKVCVELEELGFAGKYPQRHKALSQAIHKMRGDRQKFLDMIHHAFREALVQSGLPTCQIIGREKHLYSVYRKMEEKKLPFKQVMDVYAFRIIVDSFDTCYRVLGLLHSLYKPVPERFKDYIAIPKVNGYQSLHTTLFGPYGMPIEVQIRTTAMDDQANEGVAAHWLYKMSDQERTIPHEQTERWLKTLMELQSSAGSSLEFIESVKVDLFPDEIYIFTPKGRIKELPRGATVLDFAFGVHTDIGFHCTGAIIDKKRVPLSTVLTSGQTVQVTTDDKVEPDSSWLNFVVTSKARAGIRHHLKTRHRGQAIYLGNRLLHKTLKEFVLSQQEIDDFSWDKLLNEFGLSQRDELYAEIGLGHYDSLLVARRLVAISESQYIAAKPARALTKLSSLMIGNAQGRKVEYAKCCLPIPGDDIVGIIVANKTAKGLVEVHLSNCPGLQKNWHRQEQLLSLQWQTDVSGCYKVCLRCELYDRVGALAEAVAAIGDYNVNIQDLKILGRKNDKVTVSISVQVESSNHLKKICDYLLSMPVVFQVTRM